MVATRIWTAEDLETMGEEGLKFEIVRGELREVEGMGVRHGAIGGRLQGALAIHIFARDLGELLISDTRFVLPGNPRSTLAPDITYIRGDRLPSGELSEGYSRIVPDLVVEIVSPSNTEREMRNRVTIYLEGGVELVWLVRPNTRAISVFQPGVEELVLREDDTLRGEPVLPGFALPVAEVFRRRGISKP